MKKIIFTILFFFLIISLVGGQNESPESIVKKLHDFMRNNNWIEVAKLYSPNAQKEFKSVIILALESVREEERSNITKIIFGETISVDEIKDIQPDSLMGQVWANMMGQISDLGAKFDKLEIIGSVKENENLAHVLTRVTIKMGDSTISKIEKQSLEKIDDKWGLLLSDDVQAKMQQIKPRTRRGKIPSKLGKMWQEYKEMGEHEDARILEERIIELDSVGIYASNIYSKRARKIKDPGERLEYYKQLIEKKPQERVKKNAYFHIFHLVEYRLKLPEDKVIEWGEKWIKDCPKDHNAYQCLAGIYMEKKETMEKAIIYAKKAVEIFPTNPEAMDLLGWIYYKNEMYEEALSTLIKANELFHGLDAKKLYHLGAAYGKNKRYDEAFATLTESYVIQKRGDTIKCFEQLYEEKFGSLDGLQEFKLKEIEKYWATREQTPEALDNLRRSYQKSGDIEKARSLEDKIIEIDTEGTYSSKIYSERAWKIRDPLGRFEYYEQLLEKNPPVKVKQMAYSEIFDLAKNRLQLSEEKLIEWGEKWVKDCPDDPNSYQSLAYYVYMHKEETIDKAIVYAKKAVELTPKYPMTMRKQMAMASLGWIYYANKMYKDALSILIDAKELYEKPNATFLYFLGAAYGKNNRLDEALSTLAESLFMHDKEDTRTCFAQFYKEKFGSLEGLQEYKLKELEKLWAKREKTPRIMFKMRSYYLELGIIERAKSLEEKIIETDTDGYTAYRIYSERALGIKDFQKRYNYYEQLLAQNPANRVKQMAYSNLFSLARLELKLPEDKLIELGEKWIKECPRDDEAYYALTHHIYMHKEETFEKALIYSQKAAELSYYSSKAMGLLGWAYYLNGRYEKALSTLIQAKQKDSEPNAELLFYLGAVYGKNGVLDEALKNLAESLSIEDRKDANQYFDKFYKEKFGSMDGADEFKQKTISKAGTMYFTPTLDFSLKSLSGDTVESSDFRNKVVLIVIWSPTQGSNGREEFLYLPTLSNKIKNENFAIVAISRQCDKVAAQNYIESIFTSLQTPFPILFGDGADLRELWVKETPTNFILDKQGRIRFKHSGFTLILGKTFELEISYLLEEN